MGTGDAGVADGNPADDGADENGANAEAAGAITADAAGLAEPYDASEAEGDPADCAEPPGAVDGAYGDDPAGCAETLGAVGDVYGDPADRVLADWGAYGDPVDCRAAGAEDDACDPIGCTAAGADDDPDAAPSDGVADDATGTSAEIAVKLGSLGRAGTVDVPVIISLAMRAIAVISCVVSSGAVGAPMGWTPPAVMPGLAGVIDGDGLADIGTIDAGTSAGIAVTVGSFAPPPASVGATTAGDIPGEGGIVDAAAVAPCCGDSGMGDSDCVPNSSPAIREIAIIICV